MHLNALDRQVGHLRAAINAYHAEHVLIVVPKVTLPATEGRHRSLTRNEAARLPGAAVGYMWDQERGSWKRRETGTLEGVSAGSSNDGDRLREFPLIGLYGARR